MIKIISGVYGYLDKNGCVKPKTEKDDPFSLTKEQEARLVGLGVAEYVTSPTNVTAQDILPVEGTGHLDPEQLGELTNAQLKEMAEAMGIDTKKLTTKAKLIEAITEANVIQGPAEDDGEQAPTFDATEAVQ